MRFILDITRVLLRRSNAAPTGIDRVELAYLGRLLTNPRYTDVHFLVSTHAGSGILPLADVRRLYDEIQDRWSTTRNQASGGSFDRLVAELEAPVDLQRTKTLRIGEPRPDAWSASGHIGLMPAAWKGFAALRRLRREARTIPTCYLHVSHMCLEHPYIFRWLRGSDIRCVTLIHDVIPIDYPEYCGNSAYGTHVRRMETVSAMAQAVIVNSRYTGDRLTAFLEGANLPSPPIVVSQLGTDVTAGDDGRVIAPRLPYFVHIGTLEARKNIHYLLNVWRGLLARSGPSKTPRLVLVGRRGWKSQSVFDVLDRGRELAPYVSEICDLNDGEIDTLVRNSAGVVAPSSVEGFGLPGAEALRRGTPVVASDIPAHREVLGDAAILVDPIDGPRWIEAIDALAWSPKFQASRREAARAFPQVTWDAHVDVAIDGALNALGDRQCR